MSKEIWMLGSLCKTTSYKSVFFWGTEWLNGQYARPIGEATLDTKH